MSWLGDGHSKLSTGLDFCPICRSDPHASTGGGWNSDTWAHKLSACLVAKDICVGSPPISSKSTSVLPLGWIHERGTWYLEMSKTTSNHLKKSRERFRCWGVFQRQDAANLHFLRWWPTTLITFAWIIRSSVVAGISTTILRRNVGRPIASNALPVNPCLTLPHSCEVYSNWIVAIRGIKVRLEQQIYDKFRKLPH